MRVLGIADDLTGALEAGAMLGGAVHFGAHLCQADTAVIDIESRHMSAEQAARVITALGPECRGAEYIYKKTDSTLRGNIGAELEALAALTASAVAYIPAYPAMGRAVRGGCLYVHGVPVEKTQFGRDMRNPVRDGAVRNLLSRALDFEIFDGETEEDVTRAVHTALHDARFRIIAGPACVAAAMKHELGLTSPAAPLLPAVRECWIVNGSLHEASVRQMESAREQGWRVLVPPLLSDSPEQIAADMGRFVAGSMASSAPDALIVFGGDTAFGIVHALGCPALYPMQELVPGVPASRIAGSRIILITKAGGFGAPDLPRRLKRILDEQQR